MDQKGQFLFTIWFGNTLTSTALPSNYYFKMCSGDRYIHACICETKNKNYYLTLIIDNNFMLHTVTSITGLLAVHKQAPKSWELRF